MSLELTNSTPKNANLT